MLGGGREPDVEGIVEGTPGEIVAGWATFGGSRQWASDVVRVRTADGRVVEVMLADSEIYPKATVDTQWRSIEKHDWARLCPDAPPPFAEVHCTYAVLRAGQRFVAWGKALETVLVHATGSDAYRAGAEARIVKLAAETAATMETSSELEKTFGPMPTDGAARESTIAVEESRGYDPMHEAVLSRMRAGVVEPDRRWIWALLGLLLLAAIFVWRIVR